MRRKEVRPVKAVFLRYGRSAASNISHVLSVEENWGFFGTEREAREAIKEKIDREGLERTEFYDGMVDVLLVRGAPKSVIGRVHLQQADPLEYLASLAKKSRRNPQAQMAHFYKLMCGNNRLGYFDSLRKAKKASGMGDIVSWFQREDGSYGRFGYSIHPVSELEYLASLG